MSGSANTTVDTWSRGLTAIHCRQGPWPIRVLMFCNPDTRYVVNYAYYLFSCHHGGLPPTPSLSLLHCTSPTRCLKTLFVCNSSYGGHYAREYTPIMDLLDDIFTHSPCPAKHTCEKVVCLKYLTSSASDREEETMCLGWSVSFPVGIFIDAIANLPR